jgi:hypothetical protein
MATLLKLQIALKMLISVHISAHSAGAETHGVACRFRAPVAQAVERRDFASTFAIVKANSHSVPGG